MKKSYFIVVALLVVGMTAFIFVPTASLQTDSAPAPAPPVTPISDTTTAPEHGDFLNAGENVDVKSEGASGDVVVAGANVKITGNVQGYVMAAGANVTIDAPVGNDLWAAGANVDVNAPISDNAMLAGSSVNITDNAMIGGNARIAASSVNILGRVTRNLQVGAANVTLSSDIGGNADIHGERVVINPNAVIHGRLTIHSPNDPVISPQAQIMGGTEYIRSDSGRKGFGGWLGNWLIRFVWLSILGLFAVWFSSVWVNRVSDTLKRETGRSILTGLIACIAAPVLCILLLVTVIGIPLGVVLGGMTIVALMLSGMFVAYFIGGWITSSLLKQWENSNLAKVLLGSLAVSIVIMLPWIGGLAKLLIVMFGVGAFIVERRDLFRTMREQGLA